MGPFNTIDNRNLRDKIVVRVRMLTVKVPAVPAAEGQLCPHTGHLRFRVAYCIPC